MPVAVVVIEGVLTLEAPKIAAGVSNQIQLPS